jgi:hypothetical protein
MRPSVWGLRTYGEPGDVCRIAGSVGVVIVPQASLSQGVPDLLGLAAGTLNGTVGFNLPVEQGYITRPAGRQPRVFHPRRRYRRLLGGS